MAGDNNIGAKSNDTWTTDGPMFNTRVLDEILSKAPGKPPAQPEKDAGSKQSGKAGEVKALDTKAQDPKAQDTKGQGTKVQDARAQDDKAKAPATDSKNGDTKAAPRKDGLPEFKTDSDEKGASTEAKSDKGGVAATKSDKEAVKVSPAKTGSEQAETVDSSKAKEELKEKSNGDSKAEIFQTAYKEALSSTFNAESGWTRTLGLKDKINLDTINENLNKEGLDEENKAYLQALKDNFSKIAGTATGDKNTLAIEDVRAIGRMNDISTAKLETGVQFLREKFFNISGMDDKVTLSRVNQIMWDHSFGLMPEETQEQIHLIPAILESSLKHPSNFNRYGLQMKTALEQEDALSLSAAQLTDNMRIEALRKEMFADKLADTDGYGGIASIGLGSFIGATLSSVSPKLGLAARVGTMAISTIAGATAGWVGGTFMERHAAQKQHEEASLRYAQLKSAGLDNLLKSLSN